MTRMKFKAEQVLLFKLLSKVSFVRSLFVDVVVVVVAVVVVSNNFCGILNAIWATLESLSPLSTREKFVSASKSRIPKF